eukprot:TRINITY_DN3395_c0_g2_i1.p1 TRINITY_DN3395_c0_g2~~TRINITY_DN3395_c0_g2_i1.p1  ORF type:complete len:463 (+),score=43.78 TRINITY_DN3395_c0_g2_i1:205-1389(+)
MTADEKHHLRCYLRHRFRKKNGNFTNCCLPPATRGHSCALVASSGALLKRNYGKEIDAHPFVVRFNSAPVTGYEAFVGSKFSLRMGHNIRPTRRKEDKNNPDVLNETLVVCSRHNWSAHVQWKHHNVTCTGDPTITLRSMYPNRLGNSGESYGQGAFLEPSTGANAIFMALSSCKEIVLFEVIASDMAVSEPYHYYGRWGRAPRLPQHIYWGAEHDLWARLANEPLSEIKRTGKATIPGYSELKDCPNFTKQDTVVFTRPYYLAPLFESTWFAHDLLHNNRTMAFLFHEQNGIDEAKRNGSIKAPAQRTSHDVLQKINAEHALLHHHRLEVGETAIGKPEGGMVVIAFSSFCLGHMRQSRTRSTWSHVIQASLAAVVLLMTVLNTMSAFDFLAW